MPSRYDKKQPSARLGRPPESIPAPPAWLNLAEYDKLCSGDARDWALLLATREETLAENEWRKDWQDLLPNINEVERVNDPAEVDAVLERPCSTMEFWSATGDKHSLAEGAAHAVKVGFAVFAFDPHLPDDDVRAQFDAFLSRVRSDREITVGRAVRGRPTGAPSIGSANLRRWHEHRILLLFDLLLHGYDAGAERKTLAAWMFPEVADVLERGNKFDEARRLLEEARNHIRVLWAMGRDKN